MMRRRRSTKVGRFLFYENAFLGTVVEEIELAREGVGGEGAKRFLRIWNQTRIDRYQESRGESLIHSSRGYYAWKIIAVDRGDKQGELDGMRERSRIWRFTN